MSARTLLMVLALLLSACGGDAASTSTISRDSAGISIVENAAPGAGTPTYTLATAPRLMIGSRDTIAEEQFTHLVGARRLASGEIVVADVRSMEVRVFDATGSFVRLLGRRGEGPGEFGRIDAIMTGPGDVVDVWDMVTHSVSRYRASGEFVSELVADRPAMITTSDGARVGVRLEPRGQFLDGRYLSTAGQLRTENSGSGIRPHLLDLWLIDSVGGIAKFSSYQARVGYLLETPDGWSTFGGMPFGPVGSLVVADSTYLVSEGMAHEIREFALDGSLRRIARVGRALAPVTDDDRRRFIEAALDGLEGESLEHERNAFEWLTWRTSMPAYDRIVRDAADHIWARNFPDTAATATWDVFDRTGRLVATASAPSSLDVMQIGPDWVLATTKGELDEPLVLLYHLTR